VSEEQVDDDRLGAALDQLLPLKEPVEVHLKKRLGELFELEYELLLCDVTSTDFRRCRRVPAGTEPVDSKFTIDIEATTWNAFQGKEEWVGFDAYERTSVGKDVLTVHLPARTPFYNLHVQGTSEGDDDVLPVPEGLVLRRVEFGLGYDWEVENLPPDVFLKTRWTW
jgi:hypothetical protein